jgi:uncharacterized protein YhaN
VLKIKKWFIDGFGVFKNSSSGEIHANFIVLYGENEAGKSTLFSFLRGVIAGFPSARQSKEKKYGPENGGEHGGTVSLQYNEYEIDLKRYVKNKECTIELSTNDSTIDHYIIHTISEIDRENFKALFAFDLDELTQLSLLEDAALNERLFASAVSGSDSMISDAIFILKNRIKELIKPKSKGTLQLLDERLLEYAKKKKFLLLETNEAENLKKSLLQYEKQKKEIESALIEHEKRVKLEEGKERVKEITIQLQEVKSKIEEISLHRLPDEPHEKYYYQLKAKQALVEDMETYEDSDDISNKESLLLEKKEMVERLYALNEENESQDLQILDYGIVSSHQQKKEKFFLLFSLLSLISGLLLLFFSEVYYGSSFVFISLITSLFYFTSRTKNNTVLTALESAIAEKALVENKLSEIADALSESEVTSDKIDLLLMTIDRELQGLHFRKENEEKRRAIKEEQSSSLREEMIEFLQSFSCSSKEIFEERIKETIVLKELLFKEKELQALIDREGGAGEREGRSVSESNEYLSSDWQGEKKTLTDSLSDIIALISEAQYKISELSNRDSLQQCILEESSLRNEFDEYHKEWRVAMLAATLLEHSLHRLVEGRYRSVLLRGGEIFEKVSLGSYKKIIISGDKQELEVVDTAGKSRKLKELSRGTIEQLYLSIRLGLALQYGEVFMKLPILLDDSIVNFDEKRAVAIIKELSKIAGTHQILLFTCHQWIRNLVREHVPEYQEITVSDL